MSKRLYALVLVLTFLSSFMMSGAFASTPEDVYKTTEAAFGTPVIDGKIDEVWSKTNYNIIENCRTTGKTEYKGWFKVLWDSERIYILSKIYDVKSENVAGSSWLNDSVDVYIDENYGRTGMYESDDYQLRVGWDSLISGDNYGEFNKVVGKSELIENAFISEMSFPLKTTNPKDGMKIGFDVQANAAEEIGIEMRCYIWNIDINNTWKYNNPSAYGTLYLRNNVNVTEFVEPEWIPASAEVGYSEVEVPVKYELLKNQTVSVDKTETTHSLLCADDYPLMEIGELAAVIGGVCDGYTLTKDDTTLTFAEGERLAEYNGGHLMLEREPKIYNGKMYVPVSCIVPTMLYTTHYNRFGSFLEITSGTDYPESEVTFYARDFGAVGDGITYDGPAILSAVNAAINSGRPATVELDPGKTYLLGDRIDCSSFLLIDETENITFDGKGSKLLFERPTNAFIRISKSKNITIKDVQVQYIEHTSSQGKIVSIDKEKLSFNVVIDEGCPLPSSNEWCKYYWENSGGWGIGQLYDPVESHLKYTDWDHLFVSEINPVDVEKREYEIVIGREDMLSCCEVGDRFVINTRGTAYDIGTTTFDESVYNAICVRESGDITFDGVKIYASMWLGADIGLCWGRITFRNYGMLTHDGRLLAANSDGIHYWRNRAGLVVENSVLMNNLDDHINTKGETTDILEQVDEYTFKVSKDMMYRQGDELVFFDSVTHKHLGNAFIKDVEADVYGWCITVDRKIENVITQKDNKGRSSMLYNIDCSGRGSVIRNNEFMYSRRHAYITRSQNSIFMNNKIDNCGASALIAKNEIMTNNSEGPFPSSFTMRDNVVNAKGITSGYYPVEVKSWEAKMGDSAMIDGFLMENNIIDVVPRSAMVRISHAKDVYMLNNTLICNEDVDSDAVPVVLLNSEIVKLDGLKIRYKTNFKNAIVAAGCKFNEEDFTNIDLGENTAEKLLVK